MRQRDKVGRKAKAQRRKAPRQRPNTPKTTRQRSSLAAATNVARLTRERDEALAQQTATAAQLGEFTEIRIILCPALLCSSEFRGAS